MQITKRTVTRLLTEEEVIRLKSVSPFEELRQDSKAINFSFLFGASFRKFAKTELEVKWSIEKADDLIEKVDLFDKVIEMQEKYPDEPTKMHKYYACAWYIRDQFFKGYPGLMKRIKRNEEFAKEHGYIRSYHGAIRRVPMLSFCINSEGKPRKSENFKEMANLVNITANTSIQDDEVSTVNPKMVEYEESPLGKTNPMIGMTHDSVDLYVLKETAIETLTEIKELFERADEQWQHGIKFGIDMKVVDFSNPSHYYKCRDAYSFNQLKELRKNG
jgi:hypothetical protein